MDETNNGKKVKKIVPGFAEKIMGTVIPGIFGRLIPKSMTPNGMTLIGALGGLAGIVCAYLSKYHLLFLIGTVCGILTHLIADNLDGYIARKKNLTSNAGAYFDLLTDILHITFLLIALCFAGVLQFQIAIFLVPVYALIIFTSMNEILYVKSFTFPLVGPTATHFFFLIIAIGTMIAGTEPLVKVWGFGLKFGDLICLAGGIPMYAEMIRLQIVVYRNIHKAEKKG